DSFRIQVKINRPKPDPGRKIRLHIAFTQDHFAFKWYNQTELNHALTFMYPDGEGTEVVLDGNGKAEFLFAFGAYYHKSLFPVKNGSVTAFIQDETLLGYDTLRDGRILPVRDNTVLQAGRVYLGDGEYTRTENGEDPWADFICRSPETANRQSVRYYDNTLGKVDAWRWEFEGGEPAVSEEASPTVFYADPGSYAATLTVTQGERTGTLRKENTVSVLDVRPAFSIEPSPARPGRNIRLRLLSEADSCIWQLMGSSLFAAEGKEVNVSYPYEGMYNVRASVWYRSPATRNTYHFDSTAVNAIEISNNAPVANGTAYDEPAVRLTRTGRHTFAIRGAEGILEHAEVFSADGRRVLRTEKAEMDLSRFPDGIYIFCVKTRGNLPVSFKTSK
ncbi:MAG: PKD domain-containing protein, partial [Bacteroides sp.]|nr:PKD domain-containing protein [Bacteroides sp.]